MGEGQWSSRWALMSMGDCWHTAPDIVKIFGEKLAKTIIDEATALGQMKTHACGLGSTARFYLVRREIDGHTCSKTRTVERLPLQ